MVGAVVRTAAGAGAPPALVLDGEFFLEEPDLLLGLVQAGGQALGSPGGVADRLGGGAGERDGVEDAGLEDVGPLRRQAEVGGAGHGRSPGPLAAGERRCGAMPPAKIGAGDDGSKG